MIYLFKVTCWDESGKFMIFSNDKYDPEIFCPKKGMLASPPLIKRDDEQRFSRSIFKGI